MCFIPWGSLLTEETSLAVWGLQGSPGAMLDSALQQGITSTPWDDRGWRPEPLTHPSCSSSSSELQWQPCSAAAVLGGVCAQGSAPGTVLKPFWAILRQTRQQSADLRANHLCNQCQIK